MSKPQELEILKVLCASTSHVKDSDMMEFIENLYASADGEYSTLLYVSEEDCDWKSVSPEIEALYNLCIENDCAYLMLDCDGSVFNGIKTFDW